MQWRYWLHWIQSIPLSDLTRSDLATEALQQLPKLRRWSSSGSWLLVSAGAVALFYWNGRLVMATGVGAAVMLLLYRMQDWRLDVPWSQMQKFLERWNQPWAIASAGGGLAALTTYLAASVWADSESSWIALGALLQGAGTLAVLVLLTWQLLHRQTERGQDQLDQILTNLTHTDPLKRLIAVRQLTHTLTERGDDPAYRRELSDYFRLMLRREQESIVREAVLDGLRRVDRARQLKQSSQPTMDAVGMKRTQSRRRVPVR